jgi:hypothetical protein
MRKIALLVFSLLLTSFLFSTRVVFIENPFYATQSDNDNICFFLMENIYQRLGLEFSYEYVTRMEAMEMIDAEADVVIFPYIRRINMLGELMPLSNRILLSDTLLVINQKVFYDTNVHSDFEVNELSDLQGHLVGSHSDYRFEIALRRAGLTVRYSYDNMESMQRLVDQNVAFVVEEKIRGLTYLKNTIGENKANIRYKDIDLFPIPFFALAPVKNEIASGVLERINELIGEEGFVDELVERFLKSE